jgi:hypothetical protein
LRGCQCIWNGHSTTMSSSFASLTSMIWKSWRRFPVRIAWNSCTFMRPTSAGSSQLLEAMRTARVSVRGAAIRPTEKALADSTVTANAAAERVERMPAALRRCKGDMRGNIRTIGVRKTKQILLMRSSTHKGYRDHTSFTFVHPTVGIRIRISRSGSRDPNPNHPSGCRILFSRVRFALRLGKGFEWKVSCERAHARWLWTFTSRARQARAYLTD